MKNLVKNASLPRFSLYHAHVTLLFVVFVTSSGGIKIFTGDFV